MFLRERRHPTTPEHAAELGHHDRFPRELARVELTTDAPKLDSGSTQKKMTRYS
jgi:hypothetical protein